MPLTSESRKVSALTRRTLLTGAAAGAAALVAAGINPGLALAEDAITAARFTITIDGHSMATFTELEALVSEVETTDFLSSIDRGVLKKLPGKRNPPTVTLKRGLNNSLEMWAWHEAVLLGDIAHALKTCTLDMDDQNGKPVARYHMENAWPSKVEVGALKAGTSEVLMETVTIVCEHIQRVSV